jgi:N-acetylmuramoyl-L-alanine amidase
MLYLALMKRLTGLLCLLMMQLANAQSFIPGRTTGSVSFLEYGWGDDRLGGAKMTYLDSLVVLKVIDSIGNDYKVQLSANHLAYMPKAYFLSDTSLRLQPAYLSGSWRVWGDERYDYVSINLPERLPYRSIQQINPSRIVVDIYGLTSNTNWITQLKTVKEIRNVWYEQVEDDVFRVHIELKHQQHWGHAIYYNRNALQIRIKRQPRSLRPKNLVVAIDAGHGGSNTGATGMSSKILEKDYTLMIARRLESYLKRKGFRVQMTRTEDVDLNMTDRTVLLRQLDPDLMLSIHLNSSGNPEIKGASTYYRYVGFRPLSEKILDRMLDLGLNNFGNIGSFNFSLNGPMEYLNCLVEVAFLSNAEDEKKILDHDFHHDVSKKIYKGIRDFLRMK